MHKTVLAGLVAAAFLWSGIFSYRAEATMLAKSSALGVAAIAIGSFARATNVCGMNGCVKVQTSRVVHHRFHHP